MRTVTTCLLVVGVLLAAVGLPPGNAGERQPPKKLKPKFTVGKATTYVNGPLDKDGFIDYATALNELLRKGIKPDDNAMVLLTQMFGPRPEGAPLSARFYKWLGSPEPPNKGDYLVSFGRYLTDELKIAGGKALQDSLDEMDLARTRPWKTSQFPQVAGWLKFNEKALVVGLAATKRKHYYFPLVSSENGPQNLIGSLLPTVQKCRELAMALTVRAMLRTAEGRQDEAWQDLLATHRLARHVSHGSTLIEGLVGLAIDAIASNADIAHLDGAKLNAKQIKDRLSDLQKLPPMLPVAQHLDPGERLMVLDALMMIARDGVQCLEGLSGGKPSGVAASLGKLMSENTDWDPAMRTINKWFDRLAAAVHEPNRGDREKKLDQMDAELKVLKTKAASLGGFEMLFMSPQQRGERIGEVVVLLLMPAVRKVQNADDRITQIERNLHVGFALAAYNADHKVYPKKLEALTPAYLKEVPQDLFNGKPLIYRPSDKGFLLYSVGVNGKDEDGRWYDDNPPGDDPSVRLPLPAPKKN